MDPDNSAILLVNMGGPAHPGAVKDYLSAIFHDPAILPLPGALRSPLAGFIAARRAPRVADRYRLLGGRSPLHHWTPRLCRHVEAELLARGSHAPVSWAFRYCSPTIEEALRAFHSTGVNSVRLVPLFPHYTHTMTGSVQTEALRAAAEFGIRIHSVEDWGHEPAVIELWLEYLRRALAQAGPGARVLFVAHGIPQRNVRRGDDYPHRVLTTAQQLGRRIENAEWSLAFQSRVGPVRWTGPYLEDELRRLCASSAPLILMPLSFAADCLETMYDLDMVATKEALNAGVKQVVRVPAFNDDPRFAGIVAGLALQPKTIHADIC